MYFKLHFPNASNDASRVTQVWDKSCSIDFFYIGLELLFMGKHVTPFLCQKG